jgi:4-hydroxy-tetrahydrodipicolinate synthase
VGSELVKSIGIFYFLGGVKGRQNTLKGGIQDMSVERFGTRYDRLYVTVVTPFKENYDVDEPALRKFLQYFMQPKFVNAGGGVIVNPACGEIFYLSREEKKRNVEIALEECGGKVPVFAGVLGLRTKEFVDVARDAREAGADGLFLFPPVGDSTVERQWRADRDPEIWVDVAKAVIKEADLPIITHPTAPFTSEFGIGLPLGATLRMCKEIPNIVGWKMVYNYLGTKKVARGLRSLERHVGIFSAPGDLFHENLATGYFDGSATGALNYSMEIMIDHIEAWRRKDIDEARRVWKSGLEDLQDYVFSDYSRFHVMYKEAAWLRGLIPRPLMRPPMPKPKKQELLTLRELLSKANLSVIPIEDVNRVIAQLGH